MICAVCKRELKSISNRVRNYKDENAFLCGVCYASVPYSSISYLIYCFEKDVQNNKSTELVKLFNKMLSIINKYDVNCEQHIVDVYKICSKIMSINYFANWMKKFQIPTGNTKQSAIWSHLVTVYGLYHAEDFYLTHNTRTNILTNTVKNLKINVLALPLCIEYAEAYGCYNCPLKLFLNRACHEKYQPYWIYTNTKSIEYLLFALMETYAIEAKISIDEVEAQLKAIHE